MDVVRVCVCTQPWESVATFHLGSLMSVMAHNKLAGSRASRDPPSLLPSQTRATAPFSQSAPRAHAARPLPTEHLPSPHPFFNHFLLEIGMTASYEHLVTKETTGSDTSRAHSLSPEYNTGQVPRLS